MDIDDDTLQDRLLEAFDNLEYLPEISAQLHEIIIELKILVDKIISKEIKFVTHDFGSGPIKVD